MDNLMDMKVKDFSSLLAGSSPAPGGGSTAALAGSLGAALAQMVVNLSIGKKSFNSLEEAIREEVLGDFEALKRLHDELSELVEEDTKAFNLYMEAVKLSKKPDAGRMECEKALREAAGYSLRVPLKTAEKCLEVLRHLMSISRHGNKNAASDAGVGALLALAGLEGAVLNVKINLPGIEDECLKEEAGKAIKAFVLEGKKLQSAILAEVEARIGGWA